jgi:hypothetical protein
MIKNTTLSFAFCALMLSSTLVNVIPCAANTKTVQAQDSAALVRETAELNLDTTSPAGISQKTTGQRIVSGLGHATLFLPSLMYCILLFSNLSTTEKTAFAILGARGSYGAVKGMYHAITKSEITLEEPVTLNIKTAADSALLIPSLVILQRWFKIRDTRTVKLLLSLPAAYALGTSLKTIYKLVQNRSAIFQSASPDLQEPENHTITK